MGRRLNRQRLDKSLHWTTFYSEKLTAPSTEPYNVCGRYGHLQYDPSNESRTSRFIAPSHAEIVGMVGAFYISNRIPVTLPIIIAMTALCRLIVLHSKEADPRVLIAEAGAIAVLAGLGLYNEHERQT